MMFKINLSKKKNKKKNKYLKLFFKHVILKK